MGTRPLCLKYVLSLRQAQDVKKLEEAEALRLVHRLSGVGPSRPGGIRPVLVESGAPSAEKILRARILSVKSDSDSKFETAFLLSDPDHIKGVIQKLWEEADDNATTFEWYREHRSKFYWANLVVDIAVLGLHGAGQLGNEGTLITLAASAISMTMFSMLPAHNQRSAFQRLVLLDSAVQGLRRRLYQPKPLTWTHFGTTFESAATYYDIDSLLFVDEKGRPHLLFLTNHRTPKEDLPPSIRGLR